ncbi:MAG: glycosyltransferase family 9 protein [Chloroflexi bacterium]|nr:glycosyltransferase family 9 protein [Chloroflexota bacterium]
MKRATNVLEGFLDMRVLVIRPGALGDVLLTLPALQALQERFPEAAIEVMGDLAALQWLPGRSVVRSVSSFDRADLELFQPEAQPGSALQRYLEPFDLIISYATSPEHVFARNLVRVARGKVICWDARPSQGLQMHMSAYLQQPLRELGVQGDVDKPRLLLTVEDQEAAAQWWQEHGLGEGLAVAIHPGSGSTAKNWPAERFAAVAQQVRKERGMQILLVSGPADEAVVAMVERDLGGQGYVLLQQLPLPLLAALLARCWAYVGNDSGVSHLAAAMGTHVIAIFGPTDAAVWAPRGDSVRIVRGEAACAPCSVEQRRACRQRVCLEGVAVEEVMEALAHLR